MRTCGIVAGVVLALLLGACGEREAEEGPGPAVVPTVNLPRVTQVGLEPPAEVSVVIRLTRDGELTANGGEEPLGLDGLRQVLVELRRSRGPALVEPDGSSLLHAILEVDAAVPWQFTQWLMQTCAHPDVKIYRLFFGAVTRETNETGAIGATLPKDRGLAPTPVLLEARARHKIKLFQNTRGPTNLRAVWAALQRIPEAERARASFEIVTPPPKGGAVPHGYIVQVVDLVRRAGVKDLVFEGAAMPLDGASTADDPAWLAREVLRVRAREGSPFVKFDRTALGPGAEQLALPAGGRVAGIIGVGTAQADMEIVEELEEVFEDVPGEIVEDVPAVDEPVISDAPFEDPADRGPPGFRVRGKRRAPTENALHERADAAVDDALRWLAAHQAADGSWQAAKFGMWCDGKVMPDESKFPEGVGKELYDVGVTGLALNAFLGAGYTNRGKHPFCTTVARGLRFLKNVQDPEGCFGPRANQQYVYNHATAALAMVEAYGMTGSPIFKGAAQRALDFIALARNPFFAWRYGIKPGDNDTSVTVWMVSVLKSARIINADALKRGHPAPLTVDPAAFEGTRAWIEKVTDPRTGRVGYVQRGTGPARPQELVDHFPQDRSESMTAAAIWARVLAGEDPRRTDGIKKGLALLDRLPPKWELTGGIDMYYWYYGTLASHQAGGKHWQRWEAALDKAVVQTQRKDTDPCRYKGSWDPMGPWGLDGGRVYATALMTLCLETRYRYGRFFGR